MVQGLLCLTIHGSLSIDKHTIHTTVIEDLAVAVNTSYHDIQEIIARGGLCSHVLI